MRAPSLGQAKPLGTSFPNAEAPMFTGPWYEGETDLEAMAVQKVWPPRPELESLLSPDQSTSAQGAPPSRLHS